MNAFRKVALAVSSLGVASGVFGACVATGEEETACNSVGCAGYAAAYPSSYVPYAMNSYYDPVGNQLVAITYPQPQRDASIPITFDASIPIPGDAQVPIADVPELLADAREGVRSITAGVRLALDPINSLLDLTPLRTGDSLAFGPLDRGNATYDFTIRRLSTAEQRFGWKLEAKPIGSASGPTLVAGGIIRLGDTAHLGTGVLGVDGDALSAADSTVHARGKLRLGFADDSSKKVLHFALDGYTPDVFVSAPLAATAAGFATDDSESAARVALRTDLRGTATSAQELVVIKIHSTKGVGTRADAVATGGDIPANMDALVSTCVGPSLDPASVTTSTKLCSMNGGCALLSGPETISCPDRLAADPPAQSPAADDVPEGILVLPDLPETVPDGTL